MNLLIKNKSIFSTHFCFTMIIIIGMAVTYNTAVLPHRNYLLAAERCESAVDSLSKKNILLVKEVNSKKRLLEQLDMRYREMSAMVFDESQVQPFLNSFEAIAAKAGCKLESVVFVPPVPMDANTADANATGLIMHRSIVRVSGQFTAIARFIAIAQKNEKRVWIGSINIDKSDDYSAILEGEMTIIIYAIPAGKEQHANV